LETILARELNKIIGKSIKDKNGRLVGSIINARWVNADSIDLVIKPAKSRLKRMSSVGRKRVLG
jgi:hypothetical protein